MLQVAVILENQNEKNGCTILKPQSHLSGKYTNRKETNLKKINSKAGDLVIWDSRI
jgi:ectoine hydroxylase-related dioxygenase (phytanoyl-CoA dioxygenase family)